MSKIDENKNRDLDEKILNLLVKGEKNKIWSEYTLNFNGYSKDYVSLRCSILYGSGIIADYHEIRDDNNKLCGYRVIGITALGEEYLREIKSNIFFQIIKNIKNYKIFWATVAFIITILVTIIF